MNENTFTPEERVVLDQIASEFDVPADAVLELIEHESAFHSMGRRRGLFPALRAVVRRLAGAPADECPAQDGS